MIKVYELNHDHVSLNLKLIREIRESNEPKFFKVVSVWDKKLTSALVSRKAEVIYEVGKFVEPPDWLKEEGYGLLVFNDLEKALSFACSIIGHVKVYICEIDGIIENPPPPCDMFYLAQGDLFKLGRQWPANTVMVKRVKLTKKIAEMK